MFPSQMQKYSQYAIHFIASIQFGTVSFKRITKREENCCGHMPTMYPLSARLNPTTCKCPKRSIKII